jgi:hypothetical protein
MYTKNSFPRSRRTRKKHKGFPSLPEKPLQKKKSPPHIRSTLSFFLSHPKKKKEEQGRENRNAGGK